MKSKDEKRKEELLKTVRETPEERYKRVTSGKDQRHTLFLIREGKSQNIKIKMMDGIDKTKSKEDSILKIKQSFLPS